METQFKKLFEGKNTLITGGCGTIGSEILKQVLKSNPKAVRVIDSNEEKLAEMEQEFSAHPNIRFLLGNICDRKRMIMAMEEIDVVFHTAALKHVLVCEYNPFEAAKTNILGTQNVIDAAIQNNVELFVYTSSDKAVNPSNVMGASKLFAEKLVTAANSYKGKRRCIFCSVRFGNVLGSSGSVVPIFKKQISEKGPVTLTDERMTRFVMHIDQAVSLIFRAASAAKGGEIFILKMPVLKITDLTGVMIEELAPKYHLKASDIKIKRINSKPGEKLYEELLTEEEMQNAFETPELYVLLPRITEYMGEDPSFAQYTKKPELKSYRSDKLQPMTKKEIREFLKSGNLL